MQDFVLSNEDFAGLAIVEVMNIWDRTEEEVTAVHVRSVCSIVAPDSGMHLGESVLNTSLAQADLPV